MNHAVLIEDQLEIPALEGLEDFRRWAHSVRFPESGRIDYVAGHIEVDMSPEDLHTHGNVKVELIGAIWQRVRRGDLGELYTDRARVTCPQVDLSVEPDIVFVSNDAFDSGRVRLVPKSSLAADRYVELEGAPDLIVEIISDSSVRKDTARLPNAYWQAGVREYWLVDARTDDLCSASITAGRPSTNRPRSPRMDSRFPSCWIAGTAWSDFATSTADCSTTCYSELPDTSSSCPWRLSPG
jgi:Uma2 family endonuclease